MSRRRKRWPALLAVVLLGTVQHAPGLDSKVDGVIEGSFSGDDQRFVSGARVVVEPLIAWFDAPTLELMVEKYEARARGRREVRTDAHGAFQFEGLVRGQRYLVVLADVPSNARADQMKQIVEPGEPVRFDLSRVTLSGSTSVFLDGKVTLDGETVDRATLRSWYLEREGKDQSWSCDRREIITGPSSALQATAYGVFASAQKRIESPPTPFELSLEPVTSVHGYLRGLEREDVWIVPAGDYSSPERPVAVHAETGAFSIIGIAPGPYRIEIRNRSARETTVEHAFAVELHEGFQLLRLAMPETDALLKLDVTDEVTGEAIRGCGIVLSIVLSSGGSLSTGGAEIREFAGTRYTVLVDAQIRDALAARTVAHFEAKVARADLGSVVIEIDPQRWRDTVHRVVFPVRGVLAVEIEGLIGSGYEGRVDARFEPTLDAGSQRMSRERSRVLDVFGKVRIEHVDTGTYAVIATLDGAEYARETVFVQQGEVRVTLPIPAYFRVRVSFPERLRGQTAHIRFGRTVESRVIGSEPVEWNAPSGKHKIQVLGERMLINLAEDLVVDFEVTRFQRARLDFVKQNGYLAQLGLRAGDIITAIDGRGFDTPSPQELVRTRLDAGEDVGLRVERPDQILDVVVKGTQLLGEHVTLDGVLD
ncbi:MAG: hypothetical protein ACKVX7_19935 [Planctomycetota bacterium]